MDFLGSVVGAISQLPRRVLILAVALIVIIVCLLAVRGCSPSETASSASNETSAQSVGGDAATTEPSEQTAVSVPSDIDPDVAAKLTSMAAGDSRMAYIANNADAYAVDGSIVQYKLLNLAINDPQAIGFVYDFPSKYPQDTAQPYTESVSAGTFPHLYQWDERWGYTLYCNTTFALTGCCPTSLSIVYMGLTGNNDYSPADMAALATADGYESDFSGTDTGFLFTEASRLGLSCSQISVDAGSLRSSLQSGCAVICNVGPGDFTTGGHFFVITGLNSDGTLTINDPYSSVRSAKTWDIDTVLSQTKALFAYSV